MGRIITPSQPSQFPNQLCVIIQILPCDFGEAESGGVRGWYNLSPMDEGTVLNNRYQLLERLGHGGMSDVFRARDLMLERYVAIKVLHENYSQ